MKQLLVEGARPWQRGVATAAQGQAEASDRASPVAPILPWSQRLTSAAQDRPAGLGRFAGAARRFGLRVGSPLSRADRSTAAKASANATASSRRRRSRSAG